MRLNKQPVKPVRVPPTRFDRILDLAALFLLVMLWVLAISFFIDAPDKVPTGFDAAGNPRGWGIPTFYFFMPAMGIFYAAAMFAATYFPQFINMPVVLKEDTVVAQSFLLIRCCRWLNIVGLSMFLFILLYTAGFQYESLRMPTSFFVGGIFANVALMLGVIIYYCIHISRVK